MRKTVAVFQALADPTRFAVFERVVREELTVAALQSRSSVSQPAISQHLSALRSCGLVTRRKAGRQVFYRANPKGMEPLFRWIDVHRAFWQERLPRLKNLLQEMEQKENEHE